MSLVLPIKSNETSSPAAAAEVASAMRGRDERRLIGALLVIYSMFMVYGAFFPFRFTAEPRFLQSQLMRAQLWPYEAGVRKFSIPDVASNIAFFVPFGALMAMILPSAPLRRISWTRIVAAGGCGLGFSLAIEAGQIMAPGRTISAVDVLCNTLGAAGGGLLGYVLLRSGHGRLGAWMLKATREQPAILALGFVIFVAAADAFYPFAITLDASTVRENLKRLQWPLVGGDLTALWGKLSPMKVVLFAAMGELVRRCLAGRASAVATGLQAWLLTVCLAFWLEAGKLGFVGRTPSLENVLLGALSAMFGILFIPWLARTVVAHERRVTILLVVSLLLIAYAELAPFAWAPSLDAVVGQMSRVEWLPLASYYQAQTQSALLDLGQKGLWLGLFGFLMAARRPALRCPKQPWTAAVWGLGIGGILETLQLLQPSRTASTTDVLVFGAAAWGGATLCARYRALMEQR